MSPLKSPQPRLTVTGLARDLAPQIAALPRLSAIVEGFLAAAEHEMATAADLARIIDRDPDLCGWVLRQANSGYCNLVRPVASVAEACVVLGLEAVTRLVYAACTRNLLQHELGHYPLVHRGFWLHGLASGHAASQLAKRLGARSPLPPDEARVAGLLHDFGKILVDRAWPESASAPITGIADEQEMLGYDHAMASAAIAATWTLPTRVVDAIAGHHDHDLAPPARLLAATNMLLNDLGVGTATYPHLDREPPLRQLAQLLEPLSPAEGQIETWCETLIPVITGLDGMLRWTDRPPPPDLAPGEPQPLRPNSQRHASRRERRRPRGRRRR